MNHPLADEFKKGECAWCGTEGEVYCDNGFCDDCDSNTVHCCVCNERQHYESACRHVFQDSGFQWQGAGLDWGPDDNVEEAFKEFLNRMPSGFATELRRAIRSGKFYTWLIAPMIGGGGILEMNGMRTYRQGRDFGDAVLDLGERESNEDVQDGYWWLASLYQRSTRRGNRITLKWIDEWLEAREGALMRLADDGCPHHQSERTWR